MLGAFQAEFPEEPQRWQVSFAWRYQKSDRHFRGTHEEANRQAEGSEVINRIHLADVSLRYNFNPRNSLTLSVPYLMAERSSPIRDTDRVVVDRSVTHARGLSDISLVGRRLLWDPTTRPRGNISVGLGVKLPTGQNNVHDTRVSLVDGERVSTVQTVDQSIQPGDGGFGVVVDFNGYRQLGSSAQLALYGSATYLFNPEGKSGVQTYRGRESEAIMSIADQYLARVGLLAGPRSWKGVSVGLGGRVEGVPVHDLIGGSDGFRRPGYAVSAEPSLSWTRGSRYFTLSIPIAIQRNRQRSVPDLRDGSHGDAAFADWLVLAGYGVRF
ncbi:MAG: hypothetical protein ACRD2Z_05065 [Thermoanaerobaculia bacterium]